MMNLNMNMRSWDENRAETACEQRNNRTADAVPVEDGDGGDHSSSSNNSSSSMVSFEISLQETSTLDTCLLDKNNSYYSDDDNNDNDEDEEVMMMMIRRKYPWRRFKAAFLKKKKKIVVVSTTIALLFLVTLAICSSSSSSSSSRQQRQQRQQQKQQQQGQSVNFAERHVIEHDYFMATDREYVSDYAPISHKCLFGNDDACTCPDFNPREASEQWYTVHEANSKLVALSSTNDDASQQQNQHHDVIFVGDDLVALWAGNTNMTTSATTTTQSTNTVEDDNSNNHESSTTAQFIHQYFQQTFTKAGGGDVNGLALGIAGDSTSSLRWRLKNGELPPQAQAKIWWLSIGANDLDLTMAGCSEEATLLGIVRAAQDIMYHKKHEDGSVHVVIQALLPLNVKATSSSTLSSSLSSLARGDKENDTRSSNWFSSLLFHKKKNRLDNNDNDDVDPMLLLLLPSIQNINKQLAIYCQKHEGLVFFDPSTFIMDSSSSMTTNRGIAHLSVEGYQALGDAIHNEVLRIIRNQK